MKIKIRHQIHDSDKEPILLILDEEDRQTIMEMIEGKWKWTEVEEGISKHCIFPNYVPENKIKEFMKTYKHKKNG